MFWNGLLQTVAALYHRFSDSLSFKTGVLPAEKWFPFVFFFLYNFQVHWEFDPVCIETYLPLLMALLWQALCKKHLSLIPVC